MPRGRIPLQGLPAAPPSGAEAGPKAGPPPLPVRGAATEKKGPPPPPGRERRAFPRFEVMAQVQVTRESEVHIFVATNISRGGFYICSDGEAEVEYAVGAALDVLLFSPEDVEREISARAKVMRAVRGADGCVAGYGLRFESFKAGHLLRFGELLELIRNASAP